MIKHDEADWFKPFICVYHNHLCYLRSIVFMVLSSYHHCFNL
jgi:hypothetical protein